MIANLNNLSIKEDYKGKGKLTISNGQILKILHVGSTIINSHTNTHLSLNNFMSLPSLKIFLLFLNSLKIIMSFLKSLALATYSRTRSCEEFSYKEKLNMSCTKLMLPDPIRTRKLSKVKVFF